MTEEQVKENFANFLRDEAKVSKSTVSQYVYKMDTLQKWLLDKGIIDETFNIWLDTYKINFINSKIKGEFIDSWNATNKQTRNWLSAPWNHWITFNKEKSFKNDKNDFFSHLRFNDSAKHSRLVLSTSTVIRFISSLLTKQFVILTGLSGSGKTKLAQAFAMWLCADDSQYCIVPVGADWTNREPLLGFPNALESTKYVKPDNGVLDLIIAANTNADKPYFLILDEMNLSHVERYFADFLSVMESNGNLSLHAGPADLDTIPAKLKLPANLFIIGTVNIDETTYMFSPKVLDRASVIEFRVTAEEMDTYLASNASLDLESLKAAGAGMANSFISIAADKTLTTDKQDAIREALMLFFNELKKTGAEFGYRSAAEIVRFAAVINHIEAGWTIDQIIDAAIMQKLLPKVHGSRRKLEPVLKTLIKICLIGNLNIDELITGKIVINYGDAAKYKYPLSLEKIIRMYNGLINNGFTSYAEA